MPPDTRPDLILNNRYRVIKKLATGGMAYVYLGYDTILERTVAIKILKQQFSRDQSFREQFQQEARAAANLNQPNIVTIHDFGFDAKQLFIIMEFVSGVDLNTYLARNPTLTMNDVLRLIIQACDGIGYAHKAGIVHCDIKPQNMLVTPDQKLKVTDFGIARAISAAQDEQIHDVVWGSPHYYSPEQAAGYPPTPASDVYSLGIVLFESLTGRLPYESTDNNELAHMHQSAPIPHARSLNPDIPSRLDQVITRTLSKDPSLRYRSADQLSGVLETILRDFPSLAKAVKRVPSVKRDKRTDVFTRIKPGIQDLDWLTIALALLAVVAVGGLIPFWFFIWLSMNGF